MNRRLVPVLAACLVTSFFGAFLFGRSPILALAFLIPVLAMLAMGAVAKRRPALGEGVWRPAPPTGAVSFALPGTGRQVAAALGRVESRELALSPSFGVGVGFLLLILVTYTGIYANEDGQAWGEVAATAPWFAHPLAGMLVFAAHRAVTRPARDDTAELFEACPTEPVVRTVGIMRAAMLPGAVFAAFLVVFGVATYVRSPTVHGPVNANALALLLAAPMLAVGAVFLGAALGSWVRFSLVPVVAVIGVGLLAARLATAGDPGWNGLSMLSTMGPQADGPMLLSFLPTWPYLLWVVGLTGVVGVVAVLRFRRDRRVLWGGLVAVGLSVIAALLATAPMSGADARLVADLVARPAAHQTCTPFGGKVEVCTYEGYGELRDRVGRAVGPVAGALSDRTQIITVRQVFGNATRALPPEVRRLLPAGVPAPPALGEVHIDHSTADLGLRVHRLRVAFSALGLALEDDADGAPTVLGNQARGVVALWLATRGLEPDDALDFATVDTAGGDAFERGLIWPEMCGPVVWSPQDLEAARRLLRAPEASVAAVVKAQFVRWSDPSTGTDELLSALGLPSAGPYEEVVTRVESFC